MIRSHNIYLGISVSLVAKHVLVFLPTFRAAAGPVLDETIAELVAARLPLKISAATREAVIRDIVQGSNEAPKIHLDLV